MRKLMTSAVFAGLVAGGTAASQPRPALAARATTAPGRLLIITEKGTCGRAYRYNLRVSGGHIKYDGGAAVEVAGTVARNGAVKVNIRLGEKVARGTGRLSAQSGAGSWQGTGGANTCAGRWEAERR